MAKVQLLSLQPGMVLASEARDRNGRLLAEAGTFLTTDIIRVLRSWGVTACEIQESDGESSPPAENDKLTELRARVKIMAELRFKDYDQEADITRGLRELWEQHKFAALSTGEPETGGQSEEQHAGGFRFSLERLPSLEELAQREISCGKLPEVFPRLVEVVNDPRISVKDAVEVVVSDASLSERLLQIVNSSFYGVQAYVDTIHAAGYIIGASQLLTLAAGISIVEAFSCATPEIVNHRQFWRHGVACGVAARTLASYYRSPNCERFFIAGLIHEIGRLVLSAEVPGLSERVFALAKDRETPLHIAEKLIFGFDHQELGCLVVKRWKLPVSLERCMGYFHNSDVGPHQRDAAIMQIADIMAHSLGYEGSGYWYVPPLPKALWAVLDLSADTIHHLAQKIEYQLDEVMRFIIPDE